MRTAVGPFSVHNSFFIFAGLFLVYISLEKLFLYVAAMSLLLLALCIDVIAAGPIGLKARQSSAQSYASSSDLSLALSSYNAPTLNGGNQGSVSKTWQLTVDDTDSGKKQSVTGFGAAITDSTVSVFNALPSSQQSQLLQDLFTSNGVEFSLMRHTIASSDLSPNFYTYDDANGQVDTGLNSFNLGASGNAMTAFIAKAKAIQPDFTLLGTPWSAPGWMKLDGVLTGTTTNNNLNHAYVDTFAQYFVKYLQAFESGGAHVDAITIQNEPLNSQSGYPTMYVYADESAGLIQSNVGPALQSAGLSTQIWAYDHNTGTGCLIDAISNTPLTTPPQINPIILRQLSLVRPSTSTPLPGIAMPPTTTGPSLPTSTTPIPPSPST